MNQYQISKTHLLNFIYLFFFCYYFQQIRLGTGNQKYRSAWHFNEFILFYMIEKGFELNQKGRN